jgi:hypothetical protein
VVVVIVAVSGNRGGCSVGGSGSRGGCSGSSCSRCWVGRTATLQAPMHGFGSRE